MSYWIGLEGIGPNGTTAIEFKEPHTEAGGTYVIGGTTEASLNVTYNYAKLFNFRVLEGFTAEKSIPFLISQIERLESEMPKERRTVLGQEVIIFLAQDGDSDYWEPTLINVRRCLLSLQRIAQQAVDEGYGTAIWYVH